MPFQTLSGPIPARRAAAVLATTLLAGCAAQHPATKAAPAAPPALTAPYAAAAAHGVAVYRLDPAASQVLVLVGKAGALAKFGHIHVIVVGALRGFARVDARRGGRADIVFPLRSLVVDPPAERSALGGEYAKTRLNPDQRRGTRAHMLGASVLDVDRYPWAALTIFAPAAASGTAHLTVRIVLHGVARTLRTVARYEVSAKRLLAAGNFQLHQTDFGIRPYSILLGALRVKDEIAIRYHLAFDRWCPPPLKSPC